MQPQPLLQHAASDKPWHRQQSSTPPLALPGPALPVSGQAPIDCLSDPELDALCLRQDAAVPQQQQESGCSSQDTVLSSPECKSAAHNAAEPPSLPAAAALWLEADLCCTTDHLRSQLQLADMVRLLSEGCCKAENDVG